MTTSNGQSEPTNESPAPEDDQSELPAPDTVLGAQVYDLFEGDDTEDPPTGK